MMSNKGLLRFGSIIMLAAIVLGACTTPATPERVEVPVEVTRVVEVEGETITIVETEMVVVTATAAPAPTLAPASADNPVELHVGVSMGAEELSVWLPLFEQLDVDHPEWLLVLEQTPFASVNEKLNANAAAGTLPCVQEIQGLFVNPFIRQGVFITVDDLIAQFDVPMDDFWPGVLTEWRWQGATYGIPAVAAPELLVFNKEKLDAAGIDYPTDDWTFEDLREAAILLTLDSAGRNPTDPNFDPTDIQQWGFNTSPASLPFWAHIFVEPWGGDFCADEDCTRVSMTDPEDLVALEYWYDLVVNNHSALYDPFSGAQTGVPGDPFIAEKAALGFGGYFIIGVIRSAGNFDFGVRQPPLGPEGRSTAFSTRGYSIPVTCEYPEEAFRLIQELTSTEFLDAMWTKPGFSMPSRRSAAQTILETDLDGAASVLATMEFGHGFRPNGPGGFEAYGQALGITTSVFMGETDLEEGYGQVETLVNEILANAEQQQ